MAATAAGPAREGPAPRPAPSPSPSPSPSQLIARAEELAAGLVGRQAETERRSFYAPDTHEAFTEAGFYRILVPRRFGGLELDIGTHLRVSMALARGCPSTGWMFCLGTAHALAVGTLFDERAQAELFGSGDFICPAAVAPAGTARPAGDGWIVNGTWPYCSGAPYATHFIGHTLVAGADGEPPAPMLFIAPRTAWRRLDDWGDTLGLRGSGSHGIAVEDAAVPARHALPGVHLGNVSVAGGTPGRALHGNPMYGGGPVSAMFLEVAALAVGIARGALDAYEELLRSRTTLYPPIVPRAENPDFQVWYGEAAGMIGAAEAAVLQTIRRWDELCQEPPGAFTREEDLRMAGVCREAVGLCWRAVERHLFPTAGSSAVRAGRRIERVWRDLSMLHSHAGVAVFLPTAANRALVEARFAGGGAAFSTK